MATRSSFGSHPLKVRAGVQQRNCFATSGLWRGRQQVAEFFQRVHGTVEYEQFEPQEFVAQADTVVMLVWERFRVTATGKADENYWAMMFRLHQGAIAQVRIYEDSAALAAALRGN